MLKAKNNKYLIKTASILTAVFCVVISNLTVPSQAATSGRFSIHAVIPENQIDKNQTYFDLAMQPSEEQTIEVVIDNTLNEEFVADVKLNAASTGRNGLIVYTVPEVRDASMKVSINDIATLETERVIVPAGGSATVAINIKMPDEPFEGTILGGIAVTSEDDGEGSGASGVSLKNKITYVIALKLTESRAETPPDFELVSIGPELVNYKTAVVATLRNRAARIIKGLNLNAQIFKKGSETVLYELTVNDAEMAPSSTGNFVIDWQNQPFTQGLYTLKMTAEYDGETWEWDDEFKLGKETDGLNNDAVGLQWDKTWIYILLSIAALLFVWFIAYYSGKRRRKGENVSP